MRTVPVSSVPAVRCASGAQCSPARTAMPRAASCSRASRSPSRARETTARPSGARSPPARTPPPPAPRAAAPMRGGRLALAPGNLLRAETAHEADAFEQPRDARHVVRPRLEPVREILRHLLPPRLAPRPAEEKRLRLRGAQQQSRPLRAVESLVPRHRRECRAPAGEVHLQHARRLRRVHDQRHAPRAAERRNLRDGATAPNTFET